MTRPLGSVTVVELGGIGPAPYAGMVLADMGARVIKVERVDAAAELIPAPRETEIMERGKESIGLDLKSDDGREIVLRLAAEADAFIEGFRPGVTERLGVGPDDVRAVNPQITYGRITGWGQEGPLSGTAGHDIDYIAVGGVLGAIGGEDPAVPLNLIGDFGGGGMFLACGVLAGVLGARSTGEGTVIDAAMVDGVAHLSSMMHGGMAAGWWAPRRRSNLLDGGAPFYGVYRTSDDQHMAVGALEPKFFGEFVDLIGIDPEWKDRQQEVSSWGEMRAEIADRFSRETREHWTGVFAGSDACVAPVMSMAEATQHPHARARGTFVEVDGVIQPAPAPRFEGADRSVPKPRRRAADTGDILSELGYSTAHVERLRSQGVVA